MDRFLLPALQIEAILDKPTKRKRRAALEMPRALHGAFGVTVGRIQNKKPELAQLAMDVLKWVFLAREPLKPEELRHALAVEPGDDDLDWDNFISQYLLLESCLGLVIVDESTSTIRLVHKSLQDYLKIQHDKHQLFENGNREITHTCLSYISFDNYDTKDKKPPIDIFASYGFLGYASCNWL